MMRPDECYRFERCNVPVCPLDPERGAYVAGETATCPVARRIAKGVADPADPLTAAVAAGIGRVTELYPFVARRLTLAGQTPPTRADLRINPFSRPRSPAIESGGVSGRGVG